MSELLPNYDSWRLATNPEDEYEEQDVIQNDIAIEGKLTVNIIIYKDGRHSLNLAGTDAIGESDSLVDALKDLADNISEAVEEDLYSIVKEND